MAIDQTHLKLLHDSSTQRRSVYFSAADLDVVFQTRVLSVAPNHVVLANHVTLEYIRAVAAAKNFFLQCQMVRFAADQISTDGVNILFPLTSLTAIEETRQSQRFPFEPEEHVICEFTNPFDGVTKLTKGVMDMSASGLSLRTHASKLFKPGLLIPEIKVTIDGAPYTKTAGSVVYRRKLMDMKGKLRMQVGLKFEPTETK